MRWVRRTGHLDDRSIVLGCFDWDPFVALLGNGIEMVKQDVPAMLDQVFHLFESGASKPSIIKVPPLIDDL
jgi:LacI family fructose operon transcriptional repressor